MLYVTVCLTPEHSRILMAIPGVAIVTPGVVFSV
jgi:hypothetical protein